MPFVISRTITFSVGNAWPRNRWRWAMSQHAGVRLLLLETSRSSPNLARNADVRRSYVLANRNGLRRGELATRAPVAGRASVSRPRFQLLACRLNRSPEYYQTSSRTEDRDGLGIGSPQAHPGRKSLPSIKVGR